MHLKKINFFIFLFLLFNTFNISYSSDLKSGIIEIKEKNVVFKVEIAETQEKRMEGLMFRTELDEDKGMLFIFPYPDLVNIWMKNTFLSLDIVFISEENIIVDIVKEALPLSEKIYTSKLVTKYILEINSGLIRKLDINIGDKVNIEY
tara:strand:- start:92 stop:535 length:444 start_codon:yes stop_codon:yes gene_type:complete